MAKPPSSSAREPSSHRTAVRPQPDPNVPKGAKARWLRREKAFEVVLTTRFMPAGGTAGPSVRRTVKPERR